MNGADELWRDWAVFAAIIIFLMLGALLWEVWEGWKRR